MLDLDTIRSHFPAFDGGATPRFFENAGGSFPCRQTTDALAAYYRDTKVQPYAAYAESAEAGRAMDRSRDRWATALGVSPDEVIFGPSTSMNTYVLAAALGDLIGSGDEVIVTNQDHEANTGATRRMATQVGATIREWRVDAETGQLDIADLERLVGPATKLVAFPHCSNIVGTENDARRICRIAREAGAWSIVDGVSFAPHGFPDVASLEADVYLFSLYKCYSVHQGLMVLRQPLAEQLPNQGHYFNPNDPHTRMAPAGPDHAQIAAAGAVLDYVEASVAGNDTDLFTACRNVAAQWQAREEPLVSRVAGWLDERPGVRLVGPPEASTGLHRCPTIAFVAANRSSRDLSDQLVERDIMASWGGFYANRLLEAVGIDPAAGVVRLSWVHYTSPEDIDALLEALDDILD